MALAHAIMTALLEDELSGYELARSFDTTLGLFWRASHQQIYRELKKLSGQGHLLSTHIAQQGKPDKIRYTLTDSGRATLADWIYDKTRVQEGKDDLFVKLYNLSEDNAVHLIGEIEARREEMMGRLYLYERIRRRHYHDPNALSVRRRGIYLALIAGISHGEQFLSWCDTALQELAQVVPDSPSVSSL